MTLAFPNESRSCDTTRRAIRFWAYDSAMEVPFFVTWDALHGLSPNTTESESELLRAFDAHRPQIYAVAERAYARQRKGSYELGPRDFAAL